MNCMSNYLIHIRYFIYSTVLINTFPSESRVDFSAICMELNPQLLKAI